MKKVLIINGHPDAESFNFALAEAYKKGALQAQGEVREIVIRDLQFNPNLQFGYRQRTVLEADLVHAGECITWAEHLVWVHPVWWGGLPALTKGFIDRLFLPGFAFAFRENSVWWDKLLSGKTARIITTLDQPSWVYRFVFGQPSVKQLKNSILQFCGVKPVNVTFVGPLKTADLTKRNAWLTKVQRLGEKLR